MNNWDFTLIYKNEDEFNQEFDKFETDIKNLESLKGKLNNKEGLLLYRKYMNEADLRLNNLYSYSARMKDLNQKDVTSAKRYAKVYSKYMDFANRVSFIDPEILKNKREDVLSWLSDKDLAGFKIKIDNLFRMNKYVKSAKIESVMAKYNDVTSSFSKLYDALVVADNNPVKVTLTNGEVIDVNLANYTSLLAKLNSQEDRRLVFEGIYSYYDKHKKTLANIYRGIIASEYADSKNRGYKSILESHLYYNNINKKVFTSLVNVAKNNNAPLKRYYNLKKKYFGLKNLYTYDRFIKFAESKTKYTYEESRRLVLEADKKFGPDFYNKAVEVTSEGRVSVYPSDGKSTGAYSASTYDKGTFIMLNHTDDLNSAFTLAHEAGHSIHSMYSNEAQPYDTHDYVIFVAEVASTFNEARFLDYLMENVKDKNERIVLLQEAIDGLIATFYRQTVFAAFEYEAHELYEKGEVIDEEVLSNIMAKLYKKVYGLDLDKEPLKKLVWCYIPHMYHTPFYVYQYATSYAASQAIYQNVRNNVPGAFDKYIELLKSGSSDYPVELIKKAGVNLEEKEAFMAVVNRLDELVTLLEKELEK